MANNKLRGPKPISGDPEVKMPKFNFSDYDGSGRTVYHNNDEYIDFVTYNGALYVCLVPTIAPTTSAPSEGFLKLVDKGSVGPKGTPGRDGASAVAPRIGANFINDQLAVTVNDRTVAVSPSLTGPSWKPVREGDHLTWELTDDRESPDDINLMDLRPVDKCPLLLRVDSDNTKRSDEVSGPARFIQWKYEGDKYWTNLISISELMNLALCGICFWYDKHDQEWHYGHKEVIRADYASDKNGRKIISRVKLGDVLFDAGVLPINDYGVEIELINQRLAEIEDDMVKSISINGGAKLTPDNDGNVDLPIDLSDFAKKNWVDANFQPVGDYVEGIRVNGGRINRPENGIVNLEIEEGGSGDDSDCVKSVEIDGDKKYPVNGNVSFNLGNKYNLFDLNYRNGHLYKVVNGNETDLGEFGPSGEGGEGDGVGVDNIQFRINSSTGKLEFRMSIDGDWKSWNPIDLPAGSGGEGDGVGIDSIEFRLSEGDQLEYQISIDGELQDWVPIDLPSHSGGEGGEHIELSIHDGYLYISRDGGSEVPVGPVGNASGNWVKDINKSGNNLTITYWDGTSKSIAIPSGEGGGSTVVVRQILLSGTHIATITVNGTDYKIYAPNGGGGDDPDPGTGGEDAISLELTNEMDTIPVDKNKKTSSTASFLTELHAFSGSNAEIGFTQDDVTVTITPSVSGISVVKNVDNNPKKFQINVNSGIVVEDQVKIAFTLWANDDTRSARTISYTLVPLRLSQSEMFYLEINPDIIKVDADDNYSSETVSALPHWLLDGDPQSIVGWNDASKVNDPSVKYHVYYKLDNGEYIFYTDAVDITSVENVIAFELRYYYNNNKVDYIVMDSEHVPIVKDGKNGQDGQNGNPGPAGPRGDEYEKVYGLAGNALPASKYIDATQEDANGKTSADDGYLPKFVFDGVSIDATATPTGVSESNRYEYESIRRKHDGVWGPFSAPALHSNFVEAGLTDEQLENIKNDVEAAVGQDLADAQQRITNAENRLNNLDNEIDGITTTTDDLTGRVTAVEARAVYDDDDIKALAEVVIDAKKASIVAEADANTDGKINVVNQTLDALDGRITSTADSLDEVSGELNTVKTDLNAAEASIALAATKAELNGDIASVRQDMSADKAELQTAVMKGKYVWVKYDNDGNVIDVAEYDGESSKPGYDLEVLAEAMTAIRQSANEVDIVANWGDDTWAQIIAKADQSGSSIVLDADHINLSGTTDATKAVIGEATITDATITNGTITNATINDCTINSSIVSENYDNVNKTGFMLNPENDAFALYSDGVKFDSVNGLNLGSSQVISWNNLGSDVQDAINNAGGSDISPELVTKINQWSVETDTVVANNLKVKRAEVLESLTVNGYAIGTTQAPTLNINFGLSSLPEDPDPNTLYFLY